jgi:hypothetical protein
MSLVILSNTQEEYSVIDEEGERKNAESGMQKPYHFRNHLVGGSTMKIPRDSEVAVQSVKIDRLPVFDIKANSLFHFYLGKGLRNSSNAPTSSMNDNGSIPIPINCNEGMYSALQFAQELQEKLRGAISHPVWWDEVLVEVHQDTTTKEWEGYKFTTNARTKQDGTNYAVQMTSANWQAHNSLCDVDDYTIAVDGTKMEVVRSTMGIRTSMDTSGIVCNNVPANLTNGLLEWRFGGGAYGFDANAGVRLFTYNVSLSRPEHDNADRPFVLQSTYPNNFYNAGLGQTPAPNDYTLSWATRNSDGKKALFLTALVYNDTTNALETKECPYWEHNGDGSVDTGATQIDEDGIGVVGASAGYLGKFKWETIGSGMKISMMHTDGAGAEGYKVIHDTTNAASRTKHNAVLPPINQNKWALYVGCATNTIGSIIIFDKNQNDDTLRTSSYEYGGNPKTYGSLRTIGSSWWSQCRHAEGNEKVKMMTLCQGIDFRDEQKMEAGTSINWIDLDTSSYTPALSQALVVGEAVKDESPSVAGAYTPAQGANMGQQLGFGKRSVMHSAVNGTTKTYAGVAQADPAPQWEIKGRTTPELSASSLFIKVPSLTAQSYNFCKSVPSQILYHLPRFTNTGKAYGELFFEVAEKTYVALGNTEELQVNDMEVMLVNKNDRQALDLTGATVVVLHIRQRWS